MNAPGRIAGATLAPYGGDNAFRVARRGRPHAVTDYAGDRSGRNTYSFNSLGFRCGEFDPAAAIKVFSFGCSHTFGVGVQAHETYSARLVEKLAAARGIEASHACLMNFGEMGASNDYIARLLLTQCRAVRPDLVLVYFVPADRAEGFIDGEPVRIGRWGAREDEVRERLQAEPDPAIRAKILERSRLAVDFFRAYTDEAGIANALRSILLVQYFCRQHGLPAIGVWGGGEAAAAAWGRHPALAPLFAALDPAFLLLRGITEFRGLRPEYAADGRHYGPGTHERFAASLLQFGRSQQALPAGAPAAPAVSAAAFAPPPARRGRLAPWLRRLLGDG